MFRFLALLIIISTYVQAAGTCRIVGQAEYDNIVADLALEGKGLTETENILALRIRVCPSHKCPPVVGLGICMLVKK